MKKTPFLICAIVSMVAIILHGQLWKHEELQERMRQGDITPEEAERIVFECVDRIVGFHKRHHDPGVDGYEYLVLGYDAFPALYKILGNEEKMQDFDYANEVAEAFLDIDGKNPASEGKKEALEWTRRIVAIHTNPPSFAAGGYLVAKGNANDISLLRKHGHNDFTRAILREHGYTASANALAVRLALPPVVVPSTPQAGRANTNTAPKMKPSPASRTDETDDTETSSLNRTWLYLVTAIFILGIGGFYAWRKKKSNN